MLWSAGLGFGPLAIAAGLTGNVDLLWAALASFMLVRTLTLGKEVGATLSAAP